MNPQLKNKMTNILSSICMISTPKQYKLDKIKEIINDNKLTESVENETAEKIKKATSPDDLIDILKEIAKEDAETFDKLLEKIEKNQENMKRKDTKEKNINQENPKVNTKDEIIAKLSEFLKNIKNDLNQKSLNFNEFAEKIKNQSMNLNENYKKSDNKSYTKKWLRNISNLKYNNSDIDKDKKEYLKKLKKELSKKPKLFGGFGSAISNKEVQKELKELIKEIDKK